MRNMPLLLALLCGGCATYPATSPEAYPVSFTSEPPGAAVEVAGQRCVTPCTLWLTAGEHAANVQLDATKSEGVVVTAGQSDATLATNVGDALQATGAVLSAVGEAGMRAFQGASAPSPEGAVLVVTVGLVSIGSTAAGRIMIKVGGALVDIGRAPEKVHVVFKESNGSGIVTPGDQRSSPAARE